MYFFLLIVSTVIFIGVCAYYFPQPFASWYHPLTLYLFFHGLSFVLRPWLGYYYEYDLIYRGYHFTPDDYAKNMALVVTNLGLLAFAAATLTTARVPLEFGDKSTESERSKYLVTFFMLCVPLVPIFVYAVWIGWQYRLDEASLSQFDPVTGARILTGTSGYTMGMFNLGVFLLPVFAWLFRFRIWALGFLAVVFFFFQGIGFRGPAMCALFAISCFYLYGKRRLWFDSKVLVLVVVTFFVFNTVGADRGKAVRELFVEDDTVIWEDKNYDKPLEGMDFGNLEMVEFLTNTVPRKTGTYEYFVGQLRILTEPIPRALWDDKPYGQPINMFYLFRYGTPIGMTRSLPGEGWTQAGLIGVIFWCGLWGVALGQFYSWFAKGRKSIFRMALYFGVLSLMIVCYRDGLLISVFRYSFYLVPPLLAWKALHSMVYRGSLVSVSESRTQGVTDAANRSSRNGLSHAVIPRAWRRRKTSEFV